jgi:hypothetical protein
VLTVPGLHAQQAQAHPSQTLLAPAPLSDEITALTVTEYSGMGGPPCVQVALQGPQVRDGARSPLSVGTTQVWSARDFGVVTHAARLRLPIAIARIVVNRRTDWSV